MSNDENYKIDLDESVLHKCVQISELKDWIESWFAMDRYYHPNSKSTTIPLGELYDIFEKIPPVEEKK